MKFIISIFTSLFLAIFLFSILIPFSIECIFGKCNIEQIIFNIDIHADIIKFIIRHLSIQAGIGIFICIILIIKFYFFIKKYSYKINIIISILCIVFSFISLDYFYSIYNYIFKNIEKTNFIDNNYVIDNNIKWKYKKNLVFIIIESAENSYNREDIFGERLMKNLYKYSQENLSIYNHRQIRGTNYTIGGITSYLFGLPLITPIKGNLYGCFSQFLPSAKSILEEMEKAGYSLNFICGWNSHFSGFSNLINNHSNGKIFDSKFFIDNGYDEKKYKGFDGYKDIFILDYAKEIYKNKIKSKNPFAIVLHTVDTHCPSGIENKISNKYRDIRDSIIDMDNYINDFIKYILKNGENTAIVIVGDHLCMKNDVWDKLTSIEDQRTIYNCFINVEDYEEYHHNLSDISCLNKNSILNRSISSLDIAPTILEYIGCIIPSRRFGLGVSIFSKEKTLIEKYGIHYINNELGKQSILYNTFFK